ncbi:immunity 53 family protein [Planococcus ruber]|uniref:immunity 53 family protein n=1 Tax=Planococcus ruber TaxID=2027871 RepID=UPI001FEE26D0|nr:immunity 53 family protein [Planococcus ruber]MCJ1908989.1 immunity 53 family protein [Planococcus ruber]
MDTLEWIQQWYCQQCDGDWEHLYGIRIETLDNPAWSVMISLEATELESKRFESVDINRSNIDWVHCKTGYIQERPGLQFLGYGGPMNLTEILKTFKLYAEKI